jgi:uncharacterized damage-inducible protein DinB
MLEITHFRRLFSYEHWANARLLSFIQAIPTPPQKALELFSHIFNAHEIWLQRVRKEPLNTQTAWQSYDLPTIWSKYRQNITEWETYLESLDEEDYYKTINYTNFQGDDFENNLLEILTHLVNHSTYHRGQIVTQFQLLGIKPLPATDFIVFAREM